jgi:hypothetical protein
MLSFMSVLAMLQDIGYRLDQIDTSMVFIRETMYYGQDSRNELVLDPQSLLSTLFQYSLCRR